ncbi:transposase and inactivated derivatives (plasmid) [Gluconobacter frateurii NBRC 103465]|nr:transposase and inactivated derivatives [Gluconobacter frateurii NBRC 103465]
MLKVITSEPIVSSSTATSPSDVSIIEPERKHVKRFHYDSHEQLRTHLNDFMAAYNFGRRLKTLSGLTPYEYVCKIWTSEPERFIINPTHQIPGLNT